MPSVLCLMEHFDRNVIVPFKRDALITYHLNIPNTLSFCPFNHQIMTFAKDWLIGRFVKLKKKLFQK